MNHNEGVMGQKQQDWLRRSILKTSESRKCGVVVTLCHCQ